MKKIHSSLNHQMSGLCSNFQIFKISHITFCNFFEAASKQGHLVLLIANSSLVEKEQLYFCLYFLAVRGLRCCVGFSLVAASVDYSLVGVWGLLLVRSTGSRAHGFSSCGSRALEHRLSSCGARLHRSVAFGTFLDQGLNLCLLHCRWILLHWATASREAWLLFR